VLVYQYGWLLLVYILLPIPVIIVTPLVNTLIHVDLPIATTEQEHNATLDLPKSNDPLLPTTINHPITEILYKIFVYLILMLSNLLWFVLFTFIAIATGVIVVVWWCQQRLADLCELSIDGGSVVADGSGWVDIAGTAAPTGGVQLHQILINTTNLPEPKSTTAPMIQFMMTLLIKYHIRSRVTVTIGDRITIRVSMILKMRCRYYF
jgi:hypothetical protein